ncbi:MAG: sulfate adenylyltransferase subunit 2 [Nitrospira sp.]|nr:sulfate adenylyltransferase subunit 2 [Nitrospira sp.]
MKHLRELESQSVYILREAYKHFDDLAMLWSMGKDSTALLWLTRKAFFGHVPFPLVHIDTGYEMPELIEYRDRLCREWRLNLVVGQNKEALAAGMGPERGRVTCCTAMKIDALKRTIEKYKWKAVILGIRADEEGTRAKERYFSLRDQHGEWDFRDQPPELWNQFNTKFPVGSHVRVHPLLDWTELNIWEYLDLEGVPLPRLYFDQGNGKRYRSLGCVPCTSTVPSCASTISQIISELRVTTIAERSGRAQDEGRGMETLRKLGHM